MNKYLLAPIIRKTGDGYYVIEVSRGYAKSRATVIEAFPRATMNEEEGGYMVPATAESTRTIKKNFPNARWQCKPVRVPERILRARAALTAEPPPPKPPREQSGVVMSSGLYAFQERGVDFLVVRESAILADEMGLGKTVQAVVAVQKVVPKGRRLVVCPNTIVENWVDEIEKWTPDDDATIYAIGGGTTKAKRESIIAEVQADKNCWLVLSWEVLRMHATPTKKSNMRTGMELTKFPFDAVIADEAHRIKNRKAQQTQALKRIKTRYRYALTGTPIMNRPDELWSILNWLEPANFTSFWNFFEDYVDYVEGYFGKEILGAKNIDMLARQLQTRMLRREKNEVFEDLPPKTYKTIYVKLTPAQKQAYDELSEYLVTQLDDGEIVTAAAVIAQITILKEICVSLGLLSPGVTDSVKIDTALELIEDSGESKIVIFSQFAKAINLVHERMMKESIPHVMLTGKKSLVYDGTDTVNGTRGKIIKRFQEDPDIKCFIGTTQAGGVGITLTAASTVIFLDKLWTPADQTQAEDRLHRIGQKDNVYIISLLAKGTVEEHIEHTLDKKRDMIQTIMDTATKVYKPGAEIEGLEVDIGLVTKRGKLALDVATRLLRRDA